MINRVVDRASAGQAGANTLPLNITPSLICT
jgi:hypothetical protein